MSVLIFWVFQNCLHWTMCWHILDVKDEQGQKCCFFTEECSAIITAIKNQCLHKVPYIQFCYDQLSMETLCESRPSQSFGLARSLGKIRAFLLSFRIMYRLKENVVLLTKSVWRDMIEIQLLIHMRALFFHIKKFLRKCLVIKRRWLYSNSKYHPAACTFWQGLWVLFLKAL